MESIVELNNSLINLFQKLENGEVDLKLATELNNTAGKIINVQKVRIAYHALRGEAPDISFLAAPVDWKSDARKSRPGRLTDDAADSPSVLPAWPKVPKGRS